MLAFNYCLVVRNTDSLAVEIFTFACASNTCNTSGCYLVLTSQLFRPQKFMRHTQQLGQKFKDKKKELGSKPLPGVRDGKCFVLCAWASARSAFKSSYLSRRLRKYSSDCVVQVVYNFPETLTHKHIRAA